MVNCVEVKLNKLMRVMLYENMKKEAKLVGNIKDSKVYKMRKFEVCWMCMSKRNAKK